MTSAIMAALAPIIEAARSRMRADFKALAIALIAVVLAMVGMGFLVGAAYLALAPFVGFPGSAAIIGTLLLMIAAILLLVRPKRKSDPAPAPAAARTSAEIPEHPDTLAQPVPLGPLAAFVLAFVIARQLR